MNDMDDTEHYYVYLAQIGRTNNVKIGMSKDVSSRLKILSRKWKKPFKLLAVCECRDYTDAYNFEQSIHQALEDKWSGWKFARTIIDRIYWTDYQNGPDGFREVYSNVSITAIVTCFEAHEFCVTARAAS